MADEKISGKESIRMRADALEQTLAAVAKKVITPNVKASSFAALGLYLCP